MKEHKYDEAKICYKCAKKPKKFGKVNPLWCTACHTKYIKRRLCLRCNRKFWSLGVHNRICDHCRGVNQHLVECDIMSISQRERSAK